MPWLVVLLGCPWVGPDLYQERVQDADGDGVVGERFGGSDCRDDDSSVSNCDADADGYLDRRFGGEDCDDRDASVFPGAEERCDGIDNDCDGLTDNDDPDVVSERPLWIDADGDGEGDPDQQVACQVYADPNDPLSGIYVSNALDCDDTDPTIHTRADERCDGIDNNCDGQIDDGGVWFLDEDGDGYGRPGVQAAGPCVLTPGLNLANNDQDCDDTDPATFPGAPETPHDGIDQNCNGPRDDWDQDFDGFVPAEHYPAAQAHNASLPPDQQWHFEAGDCDDTDPRRFTGNPEVCDGVDNDCDGAVDAEDLAQAGPTDELLLRTQVLPFYIDADGDGYPGSATLICAQAFDPAIHFESSSDCVDEDLPGVVAAAIHPGASEICDGIDNDCDGAVDSDDDALDTSVSPAWFPDQDGDGFGDDTAAPLYQCDRPGVAYVTTAGDCDDSDPLAYPDAPWYLDLDGDGFGTDATVSYACTRPTGSWARFAGDCNDADPTYHPTTLWYRDEDGDLLGDPGVSVVSCTPPTDGRWVLAARGEDCDDSDPTVLRPLSFWPDTDGDGYGDPNAPAVPSCVLAPDGHVDNNLDCDDGDANINPTSTEVCNGVDDDCDDRVDMEDPGLVGPNFWRDEDGDGYGDVNHRLLGQCTPPFGYVALSGDCDDTDPAIHPGAPERCNGIDDNCDQLLLEYPSGSTPDLNDPSLPDAPPPEGQTVLFVVESADGYGVGAVCADPDLLQANSLTFVGSNENLASQLVGPTTPPEGCTLYVADRDEDGAIQNWNPEDVLIHCSGEDAPQGFTQWLPDLPLDCDDSDPTAINGANSALVITHPADFHGALRACDSAALLIEHPELQPFSFDASLLRPNAQLLIAHMTPMACSEWNPSGCLSIQGTLDPSIDLTLGDLGLRGPLQVRGSLTLDGGTLVSDGNGIVVDGGTLNTRDLSLIHSANSTGHAAIELQGTEPEVWLVDTSIEAFPVGLAAEAGTAHCDGCTFIDNGVGVSAGEATVRLRNSIFDAAEQTDTHLRLRGTDLSCDGCTMRLGSATTAATFDVPPDLRNTVLLEDLRLETSGSSGTAVFYTPTGTPDTVGDTDLTLSFADTFFVDRPLINIRGDVRLSDSHLDRNSDQSLTQPLVTVLTGDLEVERVTLENISTRIFSVSDDDENPNIDFYAHLVDVEAWKTPLLIESQNIEQLQLERVLVGQSPFASIFDSLVEPNAPVVDARNTRQVLISQSRFLDLNVDAAPVMRLRNTALTIVSKSLVWYHNYGQPAIKWENPNNTTLVSIQNTTFYTDQAAYVGTSLPVHLDFSGVNNLQFIVLRSLFYYRNVYNQNTSSQGSHCIATAPSGTQDTISLSNFTKKTTDLTTSVCWDFIWPDQSFEYNTQNSPYYFSSMDWATRAPINNLTRVSFGEFAIQ